MTTFFHSLLWLDPNPNFFSDSDSDPSKKFGFFRIRIRNTAHRKCCGSEKIFFGFGSKKFFFGTDSDSDSTEVVKEI
jgi:hypothetical protein